MTPPLLHLAIPHSRPTLDVEEQRAVAAVLASGFVAQGPRCAEFEQALARRIGVPYGVAVSSGLAALHVTLLGLGVGPDDDVIMPSYVCEALLQAVLYCRARPVIVDVTPATANIDPDACARAVTSATRVILVPHIFGTPADVEALARLGPAIVEDCALAIGAKRHGRQVGSLGRAAVFSFYATKMLCTGEGGMVCTADARLAQAVADLRDYGGKRDFRTRFNYKLTDMAAAMGLVQLRKLDGFIRRRRELAHLYDGLLADLSEVERPNLADYGESVFYRYVVKVPAGRREGIRRRMAEHGVQCGLGVLHPLHALAPEAAPRPCLVADDWAARGLSLPIYPLLIDEEAQRVAKTLATALKEV
jgi:dTDP-4-amino-4,6-dideoxygalactose transaminase